MVTRAYTLLRRPAGTDVRTRCVRGAARLAVRPGSPLVVFTLAAALIYGLVSASTGRWHAASFVVMLTVIAVFALEFAVLGGAWLFLAWRVSRRTGSWGVSSLVTQPLNAFVLLWFGVALGTAVVVSLPGGQPDPVDVSVQPGENVYLILLDGYPRHDSLMDYVGFDNSPFHDALEQRGFDVAERSASHYHSSIQTITTMFQTRPLDELINAEWTGSHEQHRQLWHLLNASPVASAYEAAGFTTHSIVPPSPGHVWRAAQVVHDSPWLSDFEAHLVAGGALLLVMPDRAMQRAEILDAIDSLEEAAGTSPRFVWAHIMSPHTPYVFTADGGPAEPCSAECQNHVGPPNAKLADRLTGQIQFLNARILMALDHIIAVDPEATVVVFSDHGLRRDRADMDEWFRTLFAARGKAFEEDVTTSELIPSLLVPAHATSSWRLTFRLGGPQPLSSGSYAVQVKQAMRFPATHQRLLR